jgi:phosphatidylglycerol lysyltransferase
MLQKLFADRKATAWQLMFLLSGTIWLFAPFLNPALSPHTTLISEFESPMQSFSLLFRFGDLMASVLLFGAILYVRSKPKVLGIKISPLLYVVAACMFLDAIATTNCQVIGRECTENINFSFYVHAFESVLGGTALLLLSLHDSFSRKRLTSTVFLVFQISYGIFNLTKLADTYSFGTLSQYVYVSLTITYLAWYVVSLLPARSVVDAPRTRFIRRAFTAWAYANGIFAILLSLAHIRMFGFFRNVYFGYDTAWLSQYGVLTGITMLYVSRHLSRGEHRARQLLLVLLFAEVLKNAVLSQHPILLVLYGLTFAILFVSGGSFTRGSIALSWHARFQEIGIVIAGILAAIAAVGLTLIHDHRHFEVVRNAINDFGNFELYYDKVPPHLLRSSLLAHTFTALIFGTILIILWSLFRPVRQKPENTTFFERTEMRNLLTKTANSSEDYFKLWPADKDYFWNAERTACIAYKISKSVVFVLADPIASTPAERAILLRAFMSYWKARGYRICVLLVSEPSIDLYKEVGFTTLQIGSNALVDSVQFAETTARNKWWRWQTNRGKKAGYEYRVSTAPHPVSLLTELKSVSDAWLTRPGHREQGFALGSYSDTYMQDSTIHYVVDATGSMIAFANELPIFNKLPLTTVDLMRFLPESNNAMPFLLTNTITGIGSKGTYRYFDLGFVPLANMDTLVSKIAKFAGAGRFSAAGLEQFKNKFEPEWQKCFIAYDGDVADLAIIGLTIEEAMKPSDEIDSTTGTTLAAVPNATTTSPHPNLAKASVEALAVDERNIS